MHPIIKLAALCVALLTSTAAPAKETSPLKEVIESQKRVTAQPPKPAEPASPAVQKKAGPKDPRPAHEAQAGQAAAGNKAASGSAVADPIRGRSASLEQKMIELEEAQLDAKIASEILAKRKAEAEIKKLEMELRGQTANTASFNDTVRKLERALQKAAPGKSAEPSQARPVAAPAFVTPRLAGIVESNGVRIALIEHGGRMISASQGESVAGITVERLDASSAVLNGVRTTVDARVGRLNWSSDQPAKAQGAQAAPPIALAAPAAAPTAAPAAIAPQTAAAGGRTPIVIPQAAMPR